MNKFAEKLEEWKLVERRPVLKSVESELKEFYRSREASQIGVEMASMILAAEARVDELPEAA